MRRIHVLKCDYRPYLDIAGGSKRCEIRRNDRDYKVGDYLLLRQSTVSGNGPQGPESAWRVMHVQEGYGLKTGYVCLSISRETDMESSVRFAASCEITR